MSSLNSSVSVSEPHVWLVECTRVDTRDSSEARLALEQVDEFVARETILAVDAARVERRRKPLHRHQLHRRRLERKPALAEAGHLGGGARRAALGGGAWPRAGGAAQEVPRRRRRNRRVRLRGARRSGAAGGRARAGARRPERGSRQLQEMGVLVKVVALLFRRRRRLRLAEHLMLHPLLQLTIPLEHRAWFLRSRGLAVRRHERTCCVHWGLPHLHLGPGVPHQRRTLGRRVVVRVGAEPPPADAGQVSRKRRGAEQRRRHCDQLPWPESAHLQRVVLLVDAKRGWRCAGD
mmetsp:Transcript_6534/g.17140  ORF Transcript_6534/g.17140 Transcript_6534/m.17140 type:complete len:292 (-) Transcript_6534:1652-2527(-)